MSAVGRIVVGVVCDDPAATRAYDTGTILFGPNDDPAMLAAAVIQWAIDQGADRDDILAMA